MHSYNTIHRPVLFLLLLVSFSLLKAQQPLPAGMTSSLLTAGDDASKICSNDILLYKLRQDPVYRQKEEAMNLAIRHALSRLNAAIITLPVVVHIINPNPYSITDPQVVAGVQDLNDAFSKSGSYAASAGVDTKIRFCLAQTDPEGGNTTGITRTTSYFSGHLNMDNEDARLKNLIQWDPQRYINIWLITGISGEAHASFTCGSWLRLGVGGYATMPPGGGALDGIVISTFGKILAHEMGHYLGLYHTFEGGCTNFDCTVNGDRVCDTPPDASVKPSPSCASPENSCKTDTLSAYSNGNFLTDVPDQIANFMDYSNNACSNQFTQGQADRMVAAINTQRAGLLQDECNRPCAENILAGFTRDKAYPLPGDMINFTNTSGGASNYEWWVNGMVVATSADLSYSFSVAGKNKVTLKAFNADINCFATSTDYVILNCGVTARFYTNKKTIASKAGVYTDSIVFTNNSFNGISYQWLISNSAGMPETVVSTATDLTYVFPTPATYSIRLVASNGTCSDTTAVYSVPVLDPTSDGELFNVASLCYSQNKVKVNFCIANYGYASLPKNTPVNFYDNDPRLPGANKLTPTFYLPNAVPGGNCYLCFSHIIDVEYHGVAKIYIAFNDAGTVVPIVFPNGTLQEKNYANNIQSTQATKTTITANICAGQTYAGHVTTGVYIDTFPSVINGCDSVRTLNLKVNPVYNNTITTAICAGDSYNGHTATGTYTDAYKTVQGCDSTIILHLTVKPKAATSIQAIICEGESYAGHSSSGLYTDVYPAANGCDSTRTLRLTVNPVKYTNFYPEICAGETYVAAGTIRKTTGIYRDTLQTYLGCDSIVIYNLTVHPLPVPQLGADRGVCIGSVLVLDPGAFDQYKWQDGNTSATYTTSTIGNYSVTVKDIHGCIAADTMNLTAIYALPNHFLPPDSSICKGNVVRIKAPGYTTYYWSTGSTDKFIDVTETGEYRLKVTDRNGCVGADSTQVSFYTNCVDIQIPDAFTPNLDGKNDVFMPLVPAPLKEYHLQIWDRWGLMVFETRDRSKGWDGTINGAQQNSGVFVYLITFKDMNGRDVKKYGTLTLIR